MAKRRKEGAEAEEQIDFQIPKFDEEAFLKRERRNIKTMLIAFLFGLLISIICFGFWVLIGDNYLRWELVLLVGVVNSIWIKYLFLKLKIDLTDFGRKGWLSTFFTYFFTWLLILVVLVNPPFYDAESPRVEIAVLPGMQEPGGTILIAAYIVDNVGVNKDGINFTITDPLGTRQSPDFTYEDNIFRYTYENPDDLLGTYEFLFVVSDVNDKKTTMNGSFTYSRDALNITSSLRDGIRSGDSITIKADERISKENFRVYYRIDGSQDINVDRKTPSDKERYETSAEFEGWTPNATLTVRVYAEARYYFINVPEKFSNIVTDTQVYEFSTANDPTIGTQEPLVEWNVTLASPQKPQLPNTLNYILPYPRSIGATPGFEAIMLILAVVVGMLLFKRKKKDTMP
ncbi:MAG: hypothetical protein BV459_05190 [Thermoplasmata archaeon M11B2D]|nr:MAG: hypothetical protein BV459_05190 [Thermoplasmata archaeon M11B2D]